MDQRTKLLFFFVFFPFTSFSQNDTIFNEQKKDSLTFRYSETAKINDTISNYFITTLSKSIPKILAYTQYSFSYQYNIIISSADKTPKAGNTFKLSLSVKKGECFGDVNYKGFSVADLLQPNALDLSINIVCESGKRIKPIAVEGVKLLNGESESTDFTFHDSVSNPKYQVFFTNKHFYYNDSSYLAFKKKINCINDYYQSEFILAGAVERLEKMNLENVEMVKIYEIEMNEIEKIVDNLKKKDYPAKLDLALFDPIDFVSKYKNLAQQTARQRFIIYNIVTSIDNVYYKKGLEFYEKKNLMEAKRYFEKSIASNSYFSPSYYQMANIYYVQDSLDKAIDKLSLLLSTLNPDQATLKKALFLGNTIYSLIISKGKEFEANEKYNDALFWLNKAKKFCTTLPSIECSEELQTSIAKGRFGIYSSYCIVSQKAIDKEAFDIAEIYTFKAKAYQKEYSSDIIFSTEADELLSKLVEGLTSKGLLLNSEKRYDSAMVLLEKANNLCKNYLNIKCSDKLLPAIIISRKGAYKLFIAKAAKYIEAGELEAADSAIASSLAYQQLHSAEIPSTKATDSLTLLLKKKKYDRYIEEGANYLRYKDGIRALDNFELAKNLEKSNGFEKNAILDSLLLASAEPYILNIIEIGCVKSWGNELSKARTFSDSARKLQIKYTLESDTTINNALADLDTKIFNQQCRNVQESYNELYRIAYQNIAQKKYSKADDYFAKCIKTASDYYECRIKDSLSRLSKERYQPAATYQKKMIQSDSLAAIARYSDAINKYIECSAYYISHNLVSFGLTNLALKDYLSASKDNNYLLGAAKYYFKQADYSNTFYFLEILRNKYFTDTNTVVIQQALATKLSAVDYIKNPKQKPSKLISSYTGGNAWYNSFKKAYLEQWKVLKKK